MFLTAMLCLVAGPTADPYFSDGAVLQRDRPIPVFGSAVPGTRLTVALDGESATAVADADGRWRALLPPHRAGGPYELLLDGRPIARDVLVGEVWIASGQSNMEWIVANAHDADVAEREPDPAIRQFLVLKRSLEEPADVTDGRWTRATPGAVGGFTAVGYWFAREVKRRLNVPVALLHTSWGGTPAESWTDRATLAASPVTRPILDRYVAAIQNYPAQKADYERRFVEWSRERQDSGNEGERQGWHLPGFADVDWKRLSGPDSVEKATGQDVDGAFWYRHTFDVPAEWVGKPLRLLLGPVDDNDVTYVNGVRVGKTGADVPDAYAQPRDYEIPAGVLKPIGNVLAVRVFDSYLGGGPTGGAAAFRLRDGESLLPIGAGEWRFGVERAVPAGDRPEAPFGPGNPWAPSGLYNGMIHPLRLLPVRGAIWYQGESNADRPGQYRTLFPNMIRSWRRTFDQPDLPFYFVSLANFMPRRPQPGDSGWAELRDAQDATLSLPRTGQALALDVGEEADIHPRNKREVGRRLALQALARTYGFRFDPDGPRFRRATFSGGTATVEFSSVSRLKTTNAGEPTGFQIAGADRVWRWATARVQGRRVVLSSPEVPKPVAVRYAWADNPAVNLTDEIGLPTAPFRTDRWPLPGDGKR